MLTFFFQPSKTDHLTKAMSSCQNEFLRQDGSSTPLGTIYPQAHVPRPFSLFTLMTANNSAYSLMEHFPDPFLGYFPLSTRQQIYKISNLDINLHKNVFQHWKVCNFQDSSYSYLKLLICVVNISEKGKLLVSLKTSKNFSIKSLQLDHNSVQKSVIKFQATLLYA